VLADDDSNADSVLIPGSSITGMVPTGDSELTIHFEGVVKNNATRDCLALTLTTPNTHYEAMRMIISEVGYATPNSSCITVVADDVGSKYLLNSGISGCSSITIQE